MDSLTKIYRTIKVVSLIVLALLSVIVVLQNTEPVQTEILFMTLELPRAILLLGTLMIGIAIGLLASWRIGVKKDV